MERQKANPNHAVELQGASMPLHTLSSVGLGFDLQFLGQAIRRQLALICFIVIGGIGLTALYLAAETPRYTATASVLIDRGQPKVFKIGGVLPGLDSDQHVLETQLEILRSPRIAARVLDLISSREMSPPETGATNKILNWFTLRVKEVTQPLSEWYSSITASLFKDANIQEKQPVQAAHSPLIGTLLENVRVFRLGRSLIIRLEYVDTSAKRAADIANAYIDAYIADQVEERAKDTRQANVLLRERLRELGREVTESERRIQKFRIDNDIVKIGELTLAKKEISDYMTQLVNARTRAAEAEAQLAQVETLNNQIDRDAITNQVKLLEVGIAALKRRVLDQSKRLVELEELERESEASKALYLTLLNHYKETQAQEKLALADSRIVDRAVPPSRPTHPKMLLLLSVSSVGWFGLGIAIALYRELSHRTFHSPSEIENVLGLPCIAEVPITKTAFEGKNDEAAPASICRRLDENRGDNFDQSIFAGRLWIDSLSDQGSHVVAVVSAKPKEGRSTLAALLAGDAAASGTRTLLVDADLRSAGLSHALGMQSHKGLGDIRSTTDFSRLTLNINQGCLHFCPASRSNCLSPLEILGSQELENFFSSARDNYNLIIVDTPPQSTFVDATVLIDLSDAAVIVVKAADTLQADVAGLTRELRMSGSPPAGVILNMTAPEVVKRSLSRPILSDLERSSGWTWKKKNMAQKRSASCIEEPGKDCSSTPFLGRKLGREHKAQEPAYPVRKTESEIAEPKSLQG